MVYRYLPNGSQSYTDRADEYARFIQTAQLKDEALWRKFVEVFRTREDAADHGWRGEYFGKMMRGACLTYRYFPDEELYALLERTVRDLLATADEKGRIATYPPENELCGWDLWCRKYVMVGCLYFYEICRDEEFKREILEAMVRHLDAIQSKIGKDKIPITETSEWYGGMNSSSILEPVVELFKLTGYDRYLSLAEHIIELGGCKDGSVTQAVKENKLPHEFPTTKAYETMSFFEGILAYYEATGKEEMLPLVEHFCDLVADNEITLIGCAGCHGEHFDHAAVTQAKDVKSFAIMQETCVTVTWMRLQERLLRVTGKKKYADRLECSALNALFGAVNYYGEEQFCKEEKTRLSGVPFDSYSPLVPATRGIGIGGFKRFASGGFYGCCACIGAAGTALYPLSSVMRTENGAAVLFYHEGRVEIPVGEQTLVLQAKGSLALGGMEYEVVTAPQREVELCFRAPVWSKVTKVTAAGVALEEKDGYFVCRRTWRAGDKITVVFTLTLIRHILDGKVAFTYGPFTLARDRQKENRAIDGKIALEGSTTGFLPLDPQDLEEVRLLVHTKTEDILLTDYASCGKHWTQKKAEIAVWQKRK